MKIEIHLDQAEEFTIMGFTNELIKFKKNAGQQGLIELDEIADYLKAYVNHQKEMMNYLESENASNGR